MTHDDLERWCSGRGWTKTALEVPTVLGLQRYCGECVGSWPEAELRPLSGLSGQPIAYTCPEDSRCHCAGCGEPLVGRMTVTLRRH